MEIPPCYLPKESHKLFLLNLSKGTTLALHYLDDSCIIGWNCDEVRRETKDWVDILTLEGFIAYDENCNELQRDHHSPQMLENQLS